MKPSEVIRAAITILTEQGWCQGAAARDHLGNDVKLYEVSTAGDGRARINQRAASFSIYGAIAKAMQEAGEAVPQSGLMWDTLHGLARVVPHTPKEGAESHIHPVVLYNESMDRTKEEVLAFMEGAAAELEMLELGMGQKPEITNRPPTIEEMAFGDEKMKAPRAIPAPPAEPTYLVTETGTVMAANPIPPVREPDPVAVNVPAAAEPGPPVVGQVGFPKTAIVDHLTPKVDARLPSVDWRT